MLVTLLLVGMLTSAFGIPQARAEAKTWTLDPTEHNTPLQSNAHAKIVDEDFQGKYKHHRSSVDIINPLPGQHANYSHNLYYPNGTVIFRGWWNMSYNSYVQPHVINITHVVVRPLQPNGTFWCTADTTSRWITDTDPYFWWNQTWYIPWIETNVTVGSTISWWTTTAEIVGSQTLYVVGRNIDCWVANASYHEFYDLSCYDKTSGLLVMYQTFTQGQLFCDLTLTATNVPIGEKLSTFVYFNLNPNPVGVGETLALRGILVDEYSNSLGNETVELYARPLAGSWMFITSVTTNTYGIFTWQATVPEGSSGEYIFAAYYPGSETHKSTYNFATLIIQ